MKQTLLSIFAALALFSACSSDDDFNSSESGASADSTFIMSVTWQGVEYQVPSTYDKNGNLQFLDETFRNIYENEILKCDSIVTYASGVRELAYYKSVNEMMDEFDMHFIGNDKMSSCTLRLAAKNLYSDTPAGAY